MTVASVLIPRFALIAAAGEREELLREPAALAPEPGGAQLVGEASGVAEAFGVRAGMGLGEALEVRRRRGQRREVVIGASEVRDFLSPLPVSLLGTRLDPEGPTGHELVAVLERLGVRTLEALARLPSDAVADRLGPIGLRARRLARGEDDPLRPRDPHTGLVETVQLPD